MENFTPISASIGGALIGLSAVLLMISLGKIAGITGIISGVALARTHDKLWRVAFVMGLILAPLLYSWVNPTPISFDLTADWPLLLIGGILVGFGTRLGGGCTSGHGVCGLSRFSSRSLVAVLVFMSAGIATVFVMRYIIGGV